MRHVLVLAGVIAACALAAVLVVGCLSKPRFECGNASDCVDGAAQGTCEPGGLCSFADSSCPSGRRYGDLSGSLANECVPVPPDAMIDAYVHDMYVHDARECFGGSGAYQLCFDMMPPMGTVMLAGTLDTATDPRCVPMPASWMTAGQPDSCLIVGKTVTVQTVMVTGTRPLALLGDTITISGTLDVASHRPNIVGPGAPHGACVAFPMSPSAVPVGGAGGGAGGSFMRAGGNGGTGENGTNGTAPPQLTVNPTVLRAGCSGQAGGMAGINAAGAVGVGGGAVYLTASSITFTAGGVINASGSGAGASSNNTGGSGGGSGGMIVLHAAEAITAAAGARMLANGGGGASGADNANAGNPGGDPGIASPNTPAAGATSTTGGAAGGDGFAGANNAQNGGNDSGQRNTGGGGGGGAGFIQSNRAIANIVSSPTVTVVP